MFRYCIGYHDPRQNHALGLVLVPAPIEIPLKSLKTQFTSVSAGRAHLVALTDNEGVFSIGNNAYGQCGRRIVDGEQYSSNRTVHNIPHLDNQRITAVHCGQDHRYDINSIQVF